MITGYSFSVKGRGLILLLLCLPQICSAASALDVVFNEIAWMGTPSSANNEWLELYNNTDAVVFLDDWRIAAQDNTPEIVLKGEILAHGFYLLERTADDTLPGIAAQQIYAGALKNAGEALSLLDESGKLIDRTGLESGWLAGDNSTKQTMARKDALANGETSLAWQNSQNPGGTPGKENDNPPTPSSPSVSVPASPQTPQSPLLPAATNKSSSGIVFNELLPSPAGPDEAEEWVELFNQNNFPVSLDHWQITDFFGKTEKYSFPPGATIKSLGYLVITRPESGITLNNQGDKLALIDNRGLAVDVVQYLPAPRNQSFSRFGDRWQWTTIATPGDANQKADLKETNLTPPQATTTKDISQNLTAEITEQGKQTPLERKSLSPILILALAIFVASVCGASALVLLQEKTPHI